MSPPSTSYRAVKGTRDLFPPESERFAAVESIARSTFSSYGYGEIRTPILESLELFTRSVGSTSDIVNKEMFTLTDRKKRHLALRPENTAGVARALVEHGFADFPRPLRLWYAGEQFRYERPQKGRYREFRQIGVELLGVTGAEGDSEVIEMLFAFLYRLGFHDLSVALNGLPVGEGRARYATALQEFLREHLTSLPDDDQKRFRENPLRLLDSKHPITRSLLERAPHSVDFLDDGGRKHYDRLKELLGRVQIPFTEEPRIVRGLDYYTVIVFEVVSAGLGAQDAILGGGRYDTLIEDLGGPSVPAVGFAIGEDRLLQLVPTDIPAARHVVLVVPDTTTDFENALGLARELRKLYPRSVVETDLSGRGFLRGVTRASQIALGGWYPFPVSSVYVFRIQSTPQGSERIFRKQIHTEKVADSQWTETLRSDLSTLFDDVGLSYGG